MNCIYQYMIIGPECDKRGPIPEDIRNTCDIAIICGKASSTSVLAQIAEETLTPIGLAISLQNGLGHSEILAHRLGRQRTLGGAITHGAWKDGESGVHWVGRGNIQMGSLDEGEIPELAKELLQVFEYSNLNPIWSDNVQNIVWNKLLLNVAINPVCAIAGVRNGALIEVPELWQQAMSAMLEAAAIARASGVDLGDLDLEEHLRKVVEATSENRCSMLQDLMAGRATEIDSLCGAIVERGESLGIPTPVNQSLYALVKGVERSGEFA